MFLNNDGNDFCIKETWTNKNDAIPESPSKKGLTKKSSKGKNSENILNKAGISILNNQKNNHTNIKTENDLLIDQKLSKKIVKDLLHENFSNKNFDLEKLLENNPPPVQNFGSKKNTKDNDLLGSMMTRLSKLEITSSNQREEIKEKLRIISELKDEISVLKISGSQTEAEKEIRNLKEENDSLKKQIMEMTIFLKDYGLNWIGKGEKEGDFQIQDLKKELECQKPLYKNNLPKEIDMNIISRRLEELNILMEKDGAHQVIKDKDGAFKLKKMDPLPIGFFKNGVALRGYPFYPYCSKEAQEVLEDILDGYFPLLLKKKYPNGVLFKLLDKLDDIYKSEKNNKYGDLSSIDEESLKPLSKDEFLAQLPKNVVKDGKIYEIREEIERKLDGNQDNKTEKLDSNIEIESEYLKKFKSSENLEKITTLKLRTENGKTMIFKLLNSEKILSVYEMILKMKLSESKIGFELVSISDKKIIKKDCDNSLEELGLFPMAVLQMNALKK